MTPVEQVLEQARSSPASELPELIGMLAHAQAVALSRLAQPAPSGVSAMAVPDKLVDIDEAAQKLGVGRDYLYRHARQLGFSRRVGRKLLFSTVGMEEWIRWGKAV